MMMISMMGGRCYSSYGGSNGDRKSMSKSKSEADVVVIGSGIGGLCCGALLARYEEDVLIVESPFL